MNERPKKGCRPPADCKYNSPCLRCKNQKVGCHDEKTCIRWAVFQSLKRKDAARKADEKKKEAPMRGYYSIKNRRRQWKGSSAKKSLSEVMGDRK